MGSCCAMQKQEGQDFQYTSHVTTELTLKLRINTPIIGQKIQIQFEQPEQIQHQMIEKKDSIDEYEILDKDEDSSSSSECVKKGILKSISGKSLRSGGSSVGSQKKVQFLLHKKNTHNCLNYSQRSN